MQRTKTLNNHLFHLLQIAIGNRKELTRQLTNDEWEFLYNASKKQAVPGIAFVGIMKLPKEQLPSSDLIEKWKQKALRARERNNSYNRKYNEIRNIFDVNGFASCFVMGQSNLAYYPENLKDYRSAREFDVLCWKKEQEMDKCDIIEYVNFLYLSSSKHIKPKVVYHHVDWDNVSIPVDVRMKISYFNTPWHDRRFQKWLNDNISSSNSEYGFPIASTYFNVVYQMVHLHRHLFCEGISLNQLLDYYFVLKSFRDKSIGGEIRDERLEIMRVIDSLGMRRFASGVMYVLQNVFAMSDEYLLYAPNKRSGKFVLSMTMRPDYAIESGRHNSIKRLKSVKRIFTWFNRNWRFLPQYPWEVFFDLYKRILVS